MKPLFFLLLLANAVFFLWESYIQPGLDNLALPEERSPKLGNIVLIQELPPVPQVAASEPLATLPPPAAPQAAATPPAAPPPAPATSAASAAEPAKPKVETLEMRTPAAPAQPAAPSATAGTPPPAAAPKPKAKPPETPPPAAPTASAAVTPPAPAEKPAPSPAPTASCRRIGPLANPADAQALRQRLARAGTAASVEHTPGKTETGYWVMMPPAANLAAARANKQLLVQKGAPDAMLINDGDYALGVSIGFFKDRARAEKALADAKAKGLPVTLKPRLENGGEYWLKLTSKPSPASDAQWQVFKEEHPGASIRESACR